VLVRVSRVSKVRLGFELELGSGLGLVIVFNYENVCTTPRLQVHLNSVCCVFQDL